MTLRINWHNIGLFAIVAALIVVVGMFQSWNVALAIVNMGLVEIRGVWVDPDFRGQGIGRGLMEALEAEARRRGCARAALDTYSWQAVGFYVRLGYREYGLLAYPNGTSRHFMKKELEGACQHTPGS